MGALYAYASHYLVVIFAFQIIAAVLLLVKRYVPLAVAMLAPVIVNILSFHALMAPSGLPPALFVAVLWAAIFVDVAHTKLPDWTRRHARPNGQTQGELA
jgi:putative oxidoreductase